VSKIVLCVDDSATMQQVADITFRGTEFTYVGARTYEEGLEKAKAQRPAVVLADAVMPGKNGYDLCLALKNDSATANVPVVILVGNGAPYDTTRGTQVGADANLPKPWDTQTMLDKVIEIAGKSGVAKPGAGTAATPPAPTPPAPVPPAVLGNKPAAAVAASAAQAQMAPRSATIMGMPTVKMPAGVAPVATPQPAPAAPAAKPPAVAAVPSIAPATPASSAPTTAQRPAAAAGGGGGGGGAVAPVISISSARAPMISGNPTKRSAIVERTLAKMAAHLAEATGLEPGSPELLALLKLSTEVVERIVWEIVPELAEQIIRENLHDLTARRG
jgi:CheY-like chemotaxis protein